MDKQIRFTKGVSRLHGAELEAPHDLRNARLGDRTGVEAQIEPRAPQSDTPGTPSLDLRPIRHAGGWLSGRAVARERQNLYVARPPGEGEGVEAYVAGSSEPQVRVPQITEVDVRLGGEASVANPFGDGEAWPRYIYYLLVPINDQGEAGPLFYAGARVSLNDSLPALNIKGNDALRWVSVYRTPAINENGPEVSPGAQAFYEAGRVGVGGGGTGGAGTREVAYATPYNANETGNVLLAEWFFNSTDRLYLSPSTTPGNDARLTSSALSDFTNWQVKIYDISDDSNAGVSENTLYDIYDTGTNGQGEFYVNIENTDGSSVSWIPKDLFFTRDDQVKGRPTVRLIPPNTAKTNNTATAVYADSKNWYLDVGEDQEESYNPTGEVFERPFNAYAAPGVSVPQSGPTPRITQPEGPLRPRARALHYTGGIMFAGGPRWPTKYPHPMYVETSADGFDVRLQYEYSLPSGEVVGPAVELNGVKKVAVGWQGAEQAVNVFVRAGTPSYEILRAKQDATEVTITNASDPVLEAVKEGDTVQVRGPGGARRKEVQSRSVSNGDLTFKVNGELQADSQLVFSEVSFLARSTSTTANENELPVRATEGSLSLYEGGVASIREVEVGGSGDQRIIGEEIENTSVRRYSLTGGSYDSTAGEHLFTTARDTNPHSAVTIVQLEGTRSFDSVTVVSEAGFLVGDSEERLTSLSSGDTVEVEGGPNEGSFTVESAPTGGGYLEGLTTVPVEDNPETSSEGTLSSESLTSRWRLWRRVAVGPYGTFMRSGSTFVFQASAYSQGETLGRTHKPEAHASTIEELDAVFLSRSERPMELTFDQFGVPEDEEVRALFASRLEEEEGLRAYNFYVATGGSVWAAQPDPSDRTATVYPVSTVWGIRLGEQGLPIHAPLPGGAAMVGTDGRVYRLSGRKHQRLFADGQAPWSEVDDIAYDSREAALRLATDEGVWGFDLTRTALTSHFAVDASQLAYDKSRDVVLAYDSEASQWKGLYERGFKVLSVDESTGTATVRGDQTGSVSAGDVVVFGSSKLDVVSVSVNGENTDIELSVIPSGLEAGGEIKKHVTDAAVQTQPITAGGRELEIGRVKAGYDARGYDASSKSTYARVEQSRRYGDETRDMPIPRGYEVYPPLRGEGLQLRVKGFRRLTELQIRSIEPAP